MSDLQMTLSRVVDADIEVVWRCWTDPAHLPSWFGPAGYSCRTKEIDLRQGGIWRFDMIGPDGTIWPNRHRITLYDRPHRIEFLLDGDQGDMAGMLAEISLDPLGASTRITQTITFPNAEARAGALAFGADRLGMETLAKLAKLAEAL
jgi:uncharacterized protein YndB with AHSA1/START domain